MIALTGPTVMAKAASMQAQFALAPLFTLLSALDAPFALPPPPPGLDPYPVDPAAPLVLPIPVPFLPDMDAVEVEAASLLLAGGTTVRTVAGSAIQGGSTDLRLTDPPGSAGLLTRVELRGLRFTESHRGLGDGSGTVWLFDQPGDRMTTGALDAGQGRHLHVMLQSLEGSSAGPPAAAAPAFAMPGAGGDLYGPALGGASLSLAAGADGLPTATLVLNPPLADRAFRLFLAFVSGDGGKSASGGLPNEVAPFTAWSAAEIVAHFATRPETVSVALAGPGASPAEVAAFPGELAATVAEVDLTPATRAVAKAALAAASGPDLGLTINVKSASPGEVLAAVPRPLLRYVRRPLPGPEPIRLAGAPARLAVALPEQLTPSGFSFALDGRYGPTRLLDSAPTASDTRVGHRLVPGRRAAVAVGLSRAETLLPLRRLAAFGRAEAEGELLLTLHRGEGAPADRHGNPVAVPLTSATSFAWHAAEWTAPALSPPHRERLWLVAEVTRGAFLWAALPAGGGALVSTDGRAWSDTLVAPLAQAFVDEVDLATGQPAPLHALDLHGPTGLLNADIAGVVGRAARAAFQLRWVALAPQHDPLLRAIGAAQGPLELAFACRRDVAFTVADMALTYDPWAARTAA